MKLSKMQETRGKECSERERWKSGVIEVDVEDLTLWSTYVFNDSCQCKLLPFLIKIESAFLSAFLPHLKNCFG